MSKQTAATGVKPVTSLDIRQSKGNRKLTMLTAYDYSSATLVDECDIDMILVGDSLGMVMLGRDDTISVTVDEMVHHTKAVVRGAKRSLVVADMPFMSYEISVEDAMRNAARLFQEGGARAVKLEGGHTVVPQVKALVSAGIPVVGHIGLTPQRVASLGGFKVQGKTAEAANVLVEEAKALEAAGVFCIVLEAIPAPIAARITQELSVPTIGIGAGAECDGQVLVFHDLLGLFDRFVPKFVKQYANLRETAAAAISDYKREVEDGSFPAPEHSFAMPEHEKEKFEK
ncbi:3-methyl-2-oxobutanoate hydroxymethyltransferase [Halodesulfovibrio marinisediminis]|uniref:3-methyl-2-oxobutanoate hydroxymethyltransferase n=1 Tax=Halodesulfovibrio marinisediminis DSM 17456 TaxID=1121457 RepID=A0A1N6IJP9_9BACT|nr:3-methyl-2-oxobutanoate hydroxymethyltransferase [Halodesulfovibrio marinisediminis]SIO32216.1 ketopantoate hydroxymethyltransferase [Halodesulfovibrio marinisediminis DSM 17456]